MNDEYTIPSEHLFFLNCLISDVTLLLEKYNIIYWAEGGTLLGAVREGGQIKHDDDCDLAILAHDILLIDKIIPELEAWGYSVRSHNRLLKIFIPYKQCNWGGRFVKTPCLDIFRYSMKKDNYVLHEKSQRKQWLDAKHDKNDLFPLRRVQFDDIYINIPNKPNKYLKGLYGEDYMTNKKSYLEPEKTEEQIEESMRSLDGKVVEISYEK